MKEHKAEIERIQNLLERSRERMQKDFESWLNVMLKQVSAQGGGNAASTTMGSSGAANSTFNAGATDGKVNENLQAFYKARDAIYKDLK